MSYCNADDYVRIVYHTYNFKIENNHILTKC